MAKLQKAKKMNFFTKLTVSLLVFLFVFISSPGSVLAADQVASDPAVATPDATAPAPAASTPADTSSTSTIAAPDSTVTTAPTDQTTAPADALPPAPVQTSPSSQQSTLDSTEEVYGDNANIVDLNKEGNKNLGVDQNSGALTYKYPIQIPPGRNGLQPDLALNYNSQDLKYDSLVGYGWSVNIPSIERLLKKGIDKAYSENYFTSSLSGELEDISLSDGHHGTYGAKVDNGEFLKYEYNTNNYWLVTDKKGTVYKFGYNASARQDDPNDSTHAFKWMLEEVRDTNNNYIKYEYYKNAGQIYPADIKYTGYNTTDGIFEIDFLRESRSNDYVSYREGFENTTSYRIYEIQAKVNGTWARKYELDYTASDENDFQELLTSITESGNDGSNTLALPSTSFTYQTNGGTVSYQQDTNIDYPDKAYNAVNSGRASNGTFYIDANGDSLSDIVQYKVGYTNCQYSLARSFLTDGNGWEETNHYNSFNLAKEQYCHYNGDLNIYLRPSLFIDINGDNLADFAKNVVRLNDITTQDYVYSNWNIPLSLTDFNGYTINDYVHLGDFNGDGLVDYFAKYYLNGNWHKDIMPNLGNGWYVDNTWSFPSYLGDGKVWNDGFKFADINNDGLDDILVAQNDEEYGLLKKVYLNTGDKNWVETNDFTIPNDLYFFYRKINIDLNVVSPIEFIDLNKDGLTDVIYDYKVYINDGSTFVYMTNIYPFYSPYYGQITGRNVMEINGDGMSDYVVSSKSGIDASYWDIYQYGNSEDLSDISKTVYINQKKPSGLLIEVQNSKGGSMAITYKGSAEYKDTSENLLNPHLPIIVQTVSQIEYDDGLENTWTESYEYANGEYYFSDYLNRKLAGFGQVIKTDGEGNVTKTYFHQGNATDSSHGEYSDDVSKIGKIYRQEIYDDSDNLYTKSINKWENYDLGNDRDFVKLTQTIESAYDGDNDHKDKAETYVYDNSTGNLTEKITWGEVTGSDNGTYTDTGTDKYNANYEYANAANYTSGYPKHETITDQSDNKVKETKYYYDNETYGTVDEGNLTKQEMWEESTSYIDIEKIYNSYGLVTEDIDPRGKTTDYTYDTYNLYPETVTNALDQETDYEYDYSSGKPTQITDPNSRVFQTVYDALDRVKQEKQPDIATPANLVVKTEYTYTDNTVPTKVQQTNNLDSSNSFDIYIYLDGFGRKIQERKTAEDTNNFSVKDFVYNDIGLIDKESLPYFSTGSSRTTATTDTSLYTSYTYDPLQRVLTATNAVGITTNAYDDWKLTITDANNKVKDLYKDAYDNLVRVDEHNDSNTYSTYYNWNGLGNLVEITDSQGNVRNFSYDGLGRRLSAEDLHDPEDETFGTWTYTYDDAGNLITRLDPKSQEVDWTYDDINRVLTEDYTGASGTEIAYVYDTGTDGIGRLYTATTPDVVTTYTYNALGGIKSENKNINSTDYLTQFNYDRQGNQTLITYPSNDQIKYEYNAAGLLEKVRGKQAGTQWFWDLVSNYDYSPLEQTTYQEDANGVRTYNDYDEQKLYRLKEKITASPDEVDDGSGLFGMAMDTNLRIGYESTNSNDNNSFRIAAEEINKTDDKVQHDFFGWPVNYDNYPKDKTVYLKSDKLSEAKALPKAAIEAYDKASQNWDKKPELKSSLPKEAIDFLNSKGEGSGYSLLLSGNPPKPSTDLESASLWKTENIVYNQGFENGFNYWQFQNGLGATRSEDCTTSYAGACSEKISVTTAGQFWQVQLYQVLQLKANTNYKLHFKAKASTATTFSFEAAQNHNPWYNLGLWKGDKDIGTDWTNYEYTFTALADDENAKITFELGANAADYWFDEIELIPDPLSKITNPSFENGLDSWQFYTYSGNDTFNQDATTATDGDTSLRIDKDYSSYYWQTSAANPIGQVYSAKTYIATFYAKSAEWQISRVALAQNHSPWSELTPLAEYTIYSDWTKYQIEFTPSQDDDARLIFYVGTNSNSIYFDQVRVWEKQAIKVSDSTPEFSAIYDDPDAGDYAAYYQIQVIKYDGDWNSPVWDSGKTAFSSNVLEGDRTPDISYGGTPLRLDGMKYYWRIKLWDAENNQGDWTNGKDYFTMQGKRIQDLAYTYDNVGNIMRIVDESETNTRKIADYTYDDLYRLTSATITNTANSADYTQTYTYDPLGNITYKSDVGNYQYHGNQGTSYANPHALTNVPEYNLNITYDNNGNLDQELIGSGVFFNADWDYNNRVIHTNGAWQYPADYKYDHAGQRIEKNVNSGSEITVYPNKYYNVNTQGETTKITEHVFAHGEPVLVVERQDSNLTLYFIHGDHLNSSSVMTKVNGEIEQVLDYYPFGNTRFNQQSEGENPFNEQRQFTGHEYDSDSSGLTYMGVRYYSGEAGKFISQDPVFINVGDLSSLKIWREGLTNPQRLNSYSYSRNNPLTYFDPLGLWDSSTGAVEKGDTLSNITSQINGIYSTSYSVKDIAGLNGIKNPDKIGIGQIVKPNGETPDVTQKLNTLMDEHADYAKEHNYGDIRFGLKEMPHGAWDLKSQKGDFCQESRCGGQQFESYIYSAKEIQGDAPGNLHYGYVGHAIGKSLDELLNRATQAQGISDIFSLKWPSGDRPNDTPNIIWGFNLYK